jgi:predicted Zn finger-like uncharacterized protein
MLVTRCPNCLAKFRVSPDTLSARQGKVRCGSCMSVFNAFQTLTREPDPPIEAQREIQRSPAPAAAAPAALVSASLASASLTPASSPAHAPALAPAPTFTAQPAAAHVAASVAASMAAPAVTSIAAATPAFGFDVSVTSHALADLPTPAPTSVPAAALESAPASITASITITTPASADIPTSLFKQAEPKSNNHSSLVDSPPERTRGLIAATEQSMMVQAALSQHRHRLLLCVQNHFQQHCR